MSKQSNGKVEIEICMAVFKRWKRLPKIITQLSKQTNQNFRLNIWNNSGEDISPIHIIKHDFDINIINSNHNVGSIGRFRLVPHTTGQCIIFIDDDLNLEPDFVEYMYNCWKENPDDIQGWFTRIFKTGYWDSIPYNAADMPVDYVGTGGMVLSRDIFEDFMDELLFPPAEVIKVEDLWLCYIAQREGIGRYAIEPKCSIENDDNDQYKGLIEYKEQAFNYLIEKGWKLVGTQ